MDQMIVRRTRKKCWFELNKVVLAKDEIHFGLYFNGRKDKIMKQVLVDGKYYLIKEPGSVYFDHVMPATGSASNIKFSIPKWTSKKLFKNCCS